MPEESVAQDVVSTEQDENLARIAEAFGWHCAIEEVTVDQLCAAAVDASNHWAFFESAKDALGIDEEDPDAFCVALDDLLAEFGELLGVDDWTLPNLIAAARKLKEVTSA